MNYYIHTIEVKIRNLKHDLEYSERVYPKSKRTKNLKSKLYYYTKKLSSLCD